MEYAVLEIDQLEFYKVGIPAGRTAPKGETFERFENDVIILSQLKYSCL